MLCLLTAFCSADIFSEQQVVPSQHVKLVVLTQNKARVHMNWAFACTGIKSLEITCIWSIISKKQEQGHELRKN